MDEKMRKALADQGMVAVLWSVEDVKTLRPDLIDAEAMHVLTDCVRQHDATIGINWTVIETIADMLYPKGDNNART